MRKLIGICAVLVVFLGPVATARADGLGPGGYRFLAAASLGIVIGGVALTVAAVLGGLWLKRHLRSNRTPPPHQGSTSQNDENPAE
jgi:hypothetical protein